MRRKRKPSLSAAAWLMVPLAVAVAGCGDRAAGGSSDQGNAIRVVVTDVGSGPVAGVEVRIRPEDWTRGEPLVPGRYAEGVTDALGRLACEGLREGRYVVDARDDSLAGGAEVEAGDGVTVAMSKSTSVVFAGIGSGETVALRGIDRAPEVLPDGRVRFSGLPATAVSVRVQAGSETRIVGIGSRVPGTEQELVLQAGAIDSAATWAIDPSLYPDVLVGASRVGSGSGSAAIALQRLVDGAWTAVSAPFAVDSTQAGWFRFAGGTWSGTPVQLRWTVWPRVPGAKLVWDASGVDTGNVAVLGTTGGIPVLDTAVPYLRLDSSGSVDFGNVHDTAEPQGSLEFLFRPGARFARNKAYSLVGEDGGRLLVGFLRGAVFFLKSTDYTYRWASTRPGQLAEGRWYRILATWGPQGMTISVNDTLRAWNDDTTGYSAGLATDMERRLVVGNKSSCCMEGIGIRAGLRIDGDIASVRLRTVQPVLWKDGKARACPDSAAGDLLRRCGILSSSGINLGTVRPTIYPDSLARSESDN